MQPTYMVENRYSYLVYRWRPSSNVNYEVETPETTFEWYAHSLLTQGQTYLHREEYMLAYKTFRDLQSLILKTVHPKMPVDSNQIPDFVFPKDLSIVDALVGKAADILKQTKVPDYKFPPRLFNKDSTLSAQVQKNLNTITDNGLQVTSHHGFVLEQIGPAITEAGNGNWAAALKRYTTALEKVPETDKLLRGALTHDIAVLNEQIGNRNAALELGQSSIKLLAEAKQPDAQLHALSTIVGISNRAGKPDLAVVLTKQADSLRKSTVSVKLPERDSLSLKNNLNPINFIRPGEIQPLINTMLGISLPAFPAAEIVSTNETPALMTLQYVKDSALPKAMKIQGTSVAATIQLNNTVVAATDTKAFLQTLADTVDIGLITGFVYTPIQMVAYLPHIYFFVVPMSIADCLVGMGNYQEAEKEYLSVLPYPFINKAAEIPKLWVRLAALYMEIGDDAYRKAKDNTAAFGEAKNAYEKIVKTNKTLLANSPLYKDAKFADIKTRVTNFLAASDPVAFNDNPAITIKVLDALSKLGQIQAGLNFFGFAPDYAPPFSFEYLQNTAHYFAQQASQIEQRYIQYKSTAENEELRREQLDQQAEVARQSVILEQRGLAEAQAGIAVAQASLNYAEVQRQNAVASKNDFDNARWELLEYSELEAWANASSVDKDDQVKLTITGYEYYGSEGKKRNEVLKDLASQRTMLSHDLEAAKLQRAINAANAYKGISQAQVTQAQARAAVAAQRIQIAQLQQKQAEENRDFLDMKEFSARLWYELALQARRLKTRYLDMATEIAFLMERAYNAETERNLHVIRYDYSNTAANNLMGADLLLADIDYFTLDHVTTTKTKKAPVKKVISLADSFVMAFHSLKSDGRCFFQTEFTEFDRQHPGLYLCKLRNVELVFVGITRASSIAGSLRNIGVSKFRREDGSIVTRLYPSDVMPLSQYEIRQDALAFRFNPNDLRLFENNGIDTLWQLELPKDANDFDYSEILDVHLVLYYDGFFSPVLETMVKATLPNSGSASRGFSLGMLFPDELFYLKNKGNAEIEFSADMFPYNQSNMKRTKVTLKVGGNAATIGGLKLRLKSSAHGATELVLKTDAQGEVNAATAGDPLKVLKNEPMIDKWTINITAADNPSLIKNDALDLSGLKDLLIFFEYKFDYA
ncbi:MAG: hypothetical protein H7Y09_04685 [Chitinophagaceae bacterium]|nr:hypothetical protein [Anaerolineae bacterium]